jgi:hypothetical protein
MAVRDRAIGVETVKVSRDWYSSRRCSLISLSDLHGLHWTYRTGGWKTPLAKPHLAGYVLCTKLARNIGHSCSPLHGAPPHRVKVLILERIQNPTVYRELAAIAGPRPPRPRFRT